MRRFLGLILLGYPVLGYPISDRYFQGGCVTQAFQKAILQWHPDSGQVTFINIFDLLHSAGKDPPVAGGTPDPAPTGCRQRHR